MQTTSDPFESTDQALRSTLEDAEKILESLGKATSNNVIIDGWRKEIISSLVSEVVLNCLRMRFLLAQLDATTHAGALIRLTFPMLAYVVRNLLELKVWIEFCSRSEENAHRFHHDWLRDSLGFQEAGRQLLAAIPDNAGAANAAQVIESLREGATKAGISPVDKRYKKVADAAKELGVGEFYTPLNTMLSKLAHPTAMALLAPPEGEPLARAFGGLFVAGFVLATTGLGAVREHVESLGVSFA